MKCHVELFLLVEREDRRAKLMDFFSKKNFENEMQIVKDILEEKGCVLESDHPYAYSMQYRVAFCEVVDWLEEHDYDGNLNNIGLFDGVAVYGLYDSEKITYEDMCSKLHEEARHQLTKE